MQQEKESYNIQVEVYFILMNSSLITPSPLYHHMS